MSNRMATFGEWLQTFVEEKGIDLSEQVRAKCGNTVQAGDVIQAMMCAPDSEQAAIKATFVKIDFRNGDCMHFIAHLAQACTADQFRDMTNDAFGVN